MEEAAQGLVREVVACTVVQSVGLGALTAVHLDALHLVRLAALLVVMVLVEEIVRQCVILLALLRQLQQRTIIQKYLRTLLLLI